MDNVIENNTVKIVGKVISELEFSHEMYGEGFYTVTIEVPRLSDHVDRLPVTVSERIILGLDLKPGVEVIVEGQLRSYNRYMGGSNKLILTVFARELYLPVEDELEEGLKKPNEIFLDGFICKDPVYRTTPFGREIADLLIAVNRPYNKSDYIPCIAWGRNARFCERLSIGDHIKLWGRVQSREYQKKFPNGDVINKVAYEVSISKLEFIKNDNNREEKEDQEEDME